MLRVSDEDALPQILTKNQSRLYSSSSPPLFYEGIKKQPAEKNRQTAVSINGEIR